MPLCANCLLAARAREPRWRWVPVAILLALALPGSAAAAVWFHQNRDHDVVEREPADAPRIAIRVSTHALFLNEQKLCTLPPLADQPTLGMGHECKQSHGARDFTVDSLAAKIPHADVNWPAQDVRVYFASATPYRLMVETLFTLGQHEVARETLWARDASGALMAYELEPPSARGSSTAAVRMTSPLVVRIRSDGLSLSLENPDHSEVPIGRDCEPGPGVTIPKLRAEHDYAALSACVRQLKGKIHEDVMGSATKLSASSDETAATVMRVIGALTCGSETCLRIGSAPSEPLLGKISLAVPRDPSEAAPDPRPPASIEASASVNHLRPAFKRCYGEELARAPAQAAMHVELRLTVNRLGKAERISGSEGLRQSFAHCLERAAKSAEFPAQEGGFVLQLPLDFQRE